MSVSYLAMGGLDINLLYVYFTVRISKPPNGIKKNKTFIKYDKNMFPG